MLTKNTNRILVGIIFLVFVAGIILYPSLPEQIASHWNASGEADGFTSKFWGVFLLPLIMIGMYLIYYFIPRIDPLKNNIESFRSAYNIFWVWMLLFFAYIFGLSMAWNFGYRFNFTTAIIPALAGVFYVAGALIEKSKRNWFVGIRTPWTLSSDIVWEKTHKLGGRLYKVAAIASLAGIVARDAYAIIALIAPILLVTLITVVYSYVEYRKLQ